MQFSDVAGQGFVKDRLIQGVKSGRISHAQLFWGPEGSGALPLALAYAQYVNCENPGETDSCGSCNSCNKYSKLIHPDLHFSYPTIGPKALSLNFIEEWRAALLENPYLDLNQWMLKIATENKQPNITNEEARDIIRKLSLKVFEGPYKVLIMWMPEYMDMTGNILLKLIEEPSHDTLMLLVTEDRDRILNTIQSRTQKAQLMPLNESEISEALVKRTAISVAEADRIARIADGNFSAALSLVDETENDFAALFRDWMLACVKSQMQQVMTKIEEMAELGRIQLRNLLSYGLYVFRSCMLYNNGVYESIIANQSDKEFISKFSRFLSIRNVYGFTDEFNQAIFHIGRNANPKITLLNLSLQVEKLFKAV
jgi:DNA polymerase-3 subunit delta'